MEKANAFWIVVSATIVLCAGEGSRCLAGTGGAGPTVIYSSSFEAAEGYQLGQPLAGQKEWAVSGNGGNGIVTNFFDNQLQTAFVGFNAPTNQSSLVSLFKTLNFRPLERQLPKVTFTTLLAVYSSTTTNQDFFDWTVYNADEKLLFSLSLPSASSSAQVGYLLNGGGDYSLTGQFITNSTSYLLTISMDFASNRWSASLGSAVLVADQPITTTNAVALTLGSIAAEWALRDPAAPGDDFMVFDEYRITAEPAPSPGVTPIYATSFEAAEGFVLGQPLAGQNDWFSSGGGGNGIVTNFFLNEPQTAFIGFSPSTNHDSYLDLSRRLNFSPLARQLPKVTFSTLMSVYSSTTNNQDFFDWTAYNTNAQFLFSLSFPSGPGAQSIGYLLDPGGNYLSTGKVFSNGVPYQLTIQMDFAANLWSASLDGSSIVTNLPISTNANVSLTLGGINPQWFLRDVNAPGDDFMVFDRYEIVAQAGAGTGPRLVLKSRAPSGAVELELAGQPNQNYALEASNDLKAWAPLTVLSSPSGVSAYTDTGAAALPQRFYRASQAVGAAP